MSLTQSSLRRERAKRRSTRSSLVGIPLTLRALAGPGSPWMPALCISNQTSRSLTPMPRPWMGSTRTRGEPYVPRDSACTRRMSAVSHSRRIIVGDIGRCR